MVIQTDNGPSLHIGIIGSATALGRDPVDILGRVLNIASLAMHAVLGVDLQAWVAAIAVAHDFIDPSRAVPLLRCVI